MVRLFSKSLKNNPMVNREKNKKEVDDNYGVFKKQLPTVVDTDTFTLSF